MLYEGKKITFYTQEKQEWVQGVWVTRRVPKAPVLYGQRPRRGRSPMVPHREILYVSTSPSQIPWLDSQTPWLALQIPPTGFTHPLISLEASWLVI